MQGTQINLYVFLVVAELAIMFAVASVYFWLRSRRAAQLAVKAQPAVQSEQSEQKDYPQHLEDQVEQAGGLLAALDQDEAGDHADKVKANKLRSDFLQLEHDLQHYDKETDEFHEALQDGIAKLFASQQTQQVVADDATVESEDDAGQDQDAAAENSEFSQLRNIIRTQNSAVDSLRNKLETQSSEIENYEEIALILQTYETQSGELNRCVDMLEAGAGEQAEAAVQENGGLSAMVSNQQTTIENLRTLIVKLPADHDVSEMEGTLNDIQHNNRELSDCVVVLEGENERLRAQLETAQSELLEQQQNSVDVDEAEKEKRALQARIDELKASVEEKDSIIGDLEQSGTEVEETSLENG